MNEWRYIEGTGDAYECALGCGTKMIPGCFEDPHGRDCLIAQGVEKLEADERLQRDEGYARLAFEVREAFGMDPNAPLLVGDVLKLAEQYAAERKREAFQEAAAMLRKREGELREIYRASEGELVQYNWDANEWEEAAELIEAKAKEVGGACGP